MAQRVLGIDLGSHTVKLAEVEVGFRTTELVHLRTCGVPSGPEPPLERSLQALGSIGGLQDLNVDAVSLGVPGDAYLHRVFTLPIRDPRRLTAVLANELADDIPWEMEEVVFDHLSFPAPSNDVLAVAARTQVIRELLGRLSALDLEPRTLPPAPLAYGHLVRQLEPEGTVLLIDAGHLRTNISFMRAGRPLMARTISRGGHQITEAMRQAFQLPYAEAEQLKEQRAFLLPPGTPPDQAGQPLAAVTHAALEPLMRELRLTLGVFTAQHQRRPDRVLLCGGTGLLHGLDAYLAAGLELPCERLSLSSVKDFSVDNVTDEGQAVGALALGICLEQGGRQGLDLRQGEFAYRTDQSVFREKMLTLAVSAVLILVFLVGNAIASAVALRKDERALKSQLRKASAQVFGKSMSNPRTISAKVTRGARASAAAIPEKTAYDILDIISSKVPSSKEVKLDTTRLDIKSGKTFLKGTANSRSAIGEIVSALKAVDCFTHVTSGKVSEVAEGKKAFSITINTKCF